MNKVIWHSNAPWAPTGYGQQTALFTPMLAKHYDVTLSANYGLDGAPLIWNGMPILPGLGQTHGNEALPGHVSHIFGKNWRDGLVVTLYDAQVFDPRLFSRMNAVCWAPVDHEPPPPRQIAFFRESGAIPLAMSRFGEQELAEFDPIYVPHGVDTEIYKPYPRDAGRKYFGISKDAFLVGMVAANKGRPSRKCFQQAFEAFRYFRQRHPEAQIYVHTTVEPEYAGGEDLLSLLASLGISGDSIARPNSYMMMFNPFSAKTMAEIYSTFDVLLNPSMGEGFGIPIVEAQACGVPAIVTDFSAMKETCGAGWKVGNHAYWTGQHAWMATPDVGELVEALEKCYGLSGEDRRDLSTKARQHAEQYDAQRVFTDHMLPAFKEIEERIGDLAPLKVAA